MQHFFIGVDGGATKSLVRIEDAKGTCLAQASGGPANICLSVDLAWHSINEAIANAKAQLHLTNADSNYAWHVGIGLAGCEIEEAYQNFLVRKTPFTTLIVTSDAHTACLGAHAGEDGAIISIGTGVVGCQIENNKMTKVGGLGFPHDDQGSGAWIGWQGLQQVLRWYDGRSAASELTYKIFNHFHENLATILTWASTANSTAYATLAPLVVSSANEGDTIACSILQQAANEIDLIYQALCKQQCNQQTELPCSLLGGLARSIEPYLAEHLRHHLTPPLATPEDGAIQLIKDYLAKQ